MAKGGKRRFSLNLILWFTFSAFSVALVLVYVLLQSTLTFRQYGEHAAASLRTKGEEIAQEIAQGEDADAVGSQIYSLANEAGVTLYVIDESGASVYSPFGQEDSYPELAKALAGQLADRENGLISVENGIAYAARVRAEGRDCYLFLLRSYAAQGQIEHNFILLSVVCGLFAVVLAFAVSGWMSSIITKPVAEVTDRAKELARGNYSLDFRTDYFCAEMQELSASLERARAEISKADRMQKELIANVSHDFKTPLTMIKAYASMIREISGDDKAKREAHAQIIIDETDRLASLVNDVLELSRLQAGFEKERKVFNLSEAVYRVVGRFEGLSASQGYVFSTEVEEDLYAYAAPESVDQVLYNLIGNAVNYTGEDRKVRVRLFRKGEKVRFEVIDSGKGIPPEELGGIWDRYYRSNETHKRPVQGTGLGLSIVKNILLNNGCPYGVISEVGKGSCFWVEFSEKKEKE